MKMMKTRNQSGFINPECFFMFAIALVVVAAATPFVSRIRESYPTAAIVFTVAGLAAIAITATLATIESVHFHGWKTGLSIPAILVLGIVLAAIIHHQKAEKNETENKTPEHISEGRERPPENAQR